MSDFDAETDKNLAAYSHFFDGALSPRDRMERLVADIDLSFFALDANGTLQFFHSPTKFGGNIRKPSTTYAALRGLASNATCVELFDYISTNDISFRAPTLAAFQAVSTTREIASLDVPPPLDDASEDVDPLAFKCTPIFVPPPFLRKALLATAASEDPLSAALSALEAARNFDETHGNDASFTEKATTFILPFLRWCWGAKQGLVTSVFSEVRPDNLDFSTFAISRHAQCLKPNQTSADRSTALPSGNDSSVLRQLTESIARQNLVAEKHIQLKKEELELRETIEERKTTKRLHETSRWMLRNAAAIDADLPTPDDMFEYCKAFMSQQTWADADQELRYRFEERGLDDVAWFKGTAKALYSGKFIYMNPGAPSNFSAFVFYEEQAIARSDHNSRHVLFHFQQSEGIGLTADEIQASTKQTCRIPQDYVSLGKQLEFFYGAFCIFFGPESIGATKMNELLLCYGRHSQDFKEMIAADSTFPAQFLYAVDTRVQKWLRACKKAKSRDLVEDSYLEFADLIRSVELKSFSTALPAAVSNPADANDESHKEPSRKRTKTDREKSEKERLEKELVKNDHPHPDLLLKDRNDWKKLFVGKHVEDRPKGLCLRWVFAGDCFSSCRHRKTHFSHSDLTDEQVKALQAFAKKCQNKS